MRVAGSLNIRKITQNVKFLPSLPKIYVNYCKNENATLSSKDINPIVYSSRSDLRKTLIGTDTRVAGSLNACKIGHVPIFVPNRSISLRPRLCNHRSPVGRESRESGGGLLVLEEAITRDAWRPRRPRAIRGNPRRATKYRVPPLGRRALHQRW